MLAADDDWESTRQLKSEMSALGSSHDAIVIVSAHWETDTTTITADHTLPILDEGLPTRMLGNMGPFVGSPELAEAAAARLSNIGIASRLESGRGLDHGATIALRLLAPKPNTTVLQVSLARTLDAQSYTRIGHALSNLGGLLVGSGGAVHNLATLVRFAPSDTPPPQWAADFDQQVARAAESPIPSAQLEALMATPEFRQAHPTDEHYLPLLIAAGAGGTAQLLHNSWQWSTLSMRSYRFTQPEPS